MTFTAVVAALVFSASAPAPLECLGKYYAGTAVQADGGWAWQLPDGTSIPYDDGRVKTLEERVEEPDIEDVFRVKYETGPIRPVIGEGEIEDPGRARLEPVFYATYGRTPDKVRLGKLRFFGLRIPVHERVLPAFERAVARLEPLVRERPQLLKFLRPHGGSYQWRRIRGSRLLSTHAWGIALDLNVDRSNYWKWQRPKKPLVWKNRVPQEIVDAFEAEGFIWGGRWLHYDTMHFEYRPEMLDPACRPRH